MSPRSILIAVSLLASAAACADRTVPTAPANTSGQRPDAVSPPQERMRRLARVFARSLADSAFRASLRTALAQSPFPEQKLQFQSLLTDRNRLVLRELARISRINERQIQDDAANAMALEIYLPVPEHRARWNGDQQVLVATAVEDGEVPMAYDTRGHEFPLDPHRPPSTPVLSLVPVETDFARLPSPATCTPETCPPSGGGSGGTGGGGGATPPAPGLYMTYAHTTQSFESWLKGSPEFEMHVLGQVGATDSLKDYQCAGEHAGGPYVYDQNGLDWNGSVLLFSQAQLDSYRTQHPNQSLRIFMVEDDDTSCLIKQSGTTLESILAALDAAYAIYTGGKDSTVGVAKYFQRARAFQKIWQQLAGIINTSDEMVGNAIEDDVVGQFYSGANWIIKGENNVTTGWIQLVMR